MFEPSFESREVDEPRFFSVVTRQLIPATVVGVLSFITSFGLLRMGNPFSEYMISLQNGIHSTEAYRRQCFPQGLIPESEYLQTACLKTASVVGGEWFVILSPLIATLAWLAGAIIFKKRFYSRVDGWQNSNTFETLLQVTQDPRVSAGFLGWILHCEAVVCENRESKEQLKVLLPCRIDNSTPVPGAFLATKIFGNIIVGIPYDYRMKDEKTIYRKV